jgi:hypothetical protein
MRPLRQKRLTNKQCGMVDLVLKAALDNGTRLCSRLDVEAYLKDTPFETLLPSYGDEIYDRCFSLYAQQNAQLRSPSLTGTSQLSRSDTSQERDDLSENSELDCPSFVPEVSHSKFSTRDLC